MADSYPDLHHLIPVSNFQYGFTTSTFPRDGVDHVSLNDETLGVHRADSRTRHRLVTPPKPLHPTPQLPPPKKAWEAFYPKGSFNPTAPIAGGFGFYLSGPKRFSDKLHSAKEVIFSYRMMLQEGWQWVKGGKLPGVFGGVGDLSYSCSGGRQDHRCQCFDLRPMWRRNAQGELYTYLPMTPGNTKRLLAMPPLSKPNGDFGFSVGRGSFHFPVGKWVSIAIRVKLNNDGKEDGEIEMWVDGDSVIRTKILVLCDGRDRKIKGMHFSTFFGGHSADWASPKDQRAWFADITGLII